MNGDRVVCGPCVLLVSEEPPVGFGKLVHSHIELFKWSERGTDSIFVAVNVRGYPCDGRLVEKDANGIDKIKTIFARIRFESWLADANGRIIITCNNTLAVGNIVGLGQSIAQQKKSIKT